MLLEILYQDQWIVAVNKPAGMLVHPGREPEPREQIVMKVLKDQIAHRVQTVHRLDRPTSGVLLFALDQAVEADLRRQFDQQEIEKHYTAVVAGHTPEIWRSEAPLQKSPDEPFRPATTRFEKNGDLSIGDQQFSILSAFPETGRHHQIRKHLAMDGKPIVGDYLYGSVEQMNRYAELCGEERLMLHAAELTLRHPVEGLDVSIHAALPDRFRPFSQPSRRCGG